MRANLLFAGWFVWFVWIHFNWPGDVLLSAGLTRIILSRLGRGGGGGGVHSVVLNWFLAVGVLVFCGLVWLTFWPHLLGISLMEQRGLISL